MVEANNKLYDYLRDLSKPHEELYESIIKPLITAFPIVGSSIDNIISYRITKRRFDVLKRLLFEIAAGLNELSNKHILDDNFLRTDEYTCFFEDVLISATTAKNTSKINNYKNAILNISKKERIELDLADYYLHCLNSLTSLHLTLLEISVQKDIYDRFLQHNPPNSPQYLLIKEALPDLPSDIAQSIITSTHIFFLYGGYTKQQNIQDDKYKYDTNKYHTNIIDTSGLKFLDFINRY
ncbi:MAG TPA: hypothetical protein VM054_10425 [bacterium]|nr:hypothetical protein [bacterium]